MDIVYGRREKKEIITSESTKAENLRAWKELLSSEEAKGFVSEVLEKSGILFGQTPKAKLINTFTNIALMVAAFVCVGVLGIYELAPEGTVGILAGIIIGYFFKKSD